MHNINARIFLRLQYIMFELPVVPQSCRRTVELSRSRRRSSAARARLWSAKATVVTPPCTSAGIATPACPWWTLVLLWRYQTVFVSVFLNSLSSHPCFSSQARSCGVQSSVFVQCVLFVLVFFFTGKGPFNVLCLSSHVCVFGLCLSSLHLYLHVSLSTSLSPLCPR